MQFQESIRHVLFTRYMAIFIGRASRSEFWWFQLFLLLLVVALVLFVLMLAGMAGFSLTDPESFSNAFVGAGMAFGLILFIIVYFALINLSIYFLAPAALAVTVRRLHDRNMSGWWLLLPLAIALIPVVGVIISFVGMIVVLSLKGTDGPNRFGADPLKPEASSDIFI